MKGARQLTYSRGLRERYAVPVTTDEELARPDVGGDELLTLNREAWRLVCSVPGLPADVLRAAEDGGTVAAVELLESLPYWLPGALLSHSGWPMGTSPLSPGGVTLAA